MLCLRLRKFRKFGKFGKFGKFDAGRAASWALVGNRREARACPRTSPGQPLSRAGYRVPGAGCRPSGRGVVALPGHGMRSFQDVINRILYKMPAADGVRWQRDSNRSSGVRRSVPSATLASMTFANDMRFDPGPVSAV